MTLSTTTGFVQVGDRGRDRPRLHAASRRPPGPTTKRTFSSRRKCAWPRPRPRRSPLSPNAALKWQAGVFFFTQNYDQNAVNHLAPPFDPRRSASPIDQTSPLADARRSRRRALRSGHADLERSLDVTLGARFDHERKEALLETFFSPALFPGTVGRYADELLERLAAGCRSPIASSPT